jgi:hypothetical protein
MLKVGDVVDVAAGLQRSSTCTGSGLSLKFPILVYVLVVKAVVRISVFTFVLPASIDSSALLGEDFVAERAKPVDCWMCVHCRLTQAFFSFPGPPFDTLSLQKRHTPQQTVVHPKHFPQRVFFPLVKLDGGVVVWLLNGRGL